MLCLSLCSFNTPLHFSKAELEELRGTNLAEASKTVYRNLQEQWDRLGPAMITAAKHAGLRHEPTFEDLLWAFSVYWSRGLSLPIPQEGAGQNFGAGPHDLIEVLKYSMAAFSE